MRDAEIRVCHAGEKKDEGTYTCANCGKKVYLVTGNILPKCPKCGETNFTYEIIK